VRTIDADILAQLESGAIRPFVLVKIETGSTHCYTDCDVPLVYEGDVYAPHGFNVAPIQYSNAQIVDKAEIDIDNVSQYLMGDFVGGTPQGGDVTIYCVVVKTELGEEGDRHIFTEEMYEMTVGRILTEESDNLSTDPANDLLMTTQWTSRTTGELTTEDDFNIDWDVVDLQGYQPTDATVFFKGFVDEWSLVEDRISITVTNQFTRWTQKTLMLHSASCRWKQFKGDECGYTGGAASCNRTYVQCGIYNNTSNFGGFRFLPSVEDKQIWWGPTPEVE